MTEKLADIAAAMVAPGKGVLAADESSGTIKKRFDSIGVASTEDARRDYREMLFRAREAMQNYVSGVILYDETIRQKAKDGTPLVDVIKAAGAIPGIKVDEGAKTLPGPTSAVEKVTEGLDGLRERLAEYYKLGARFAKWRAVITIADGAPTWNCTKANAHALARYAALCQEAGIVPIVEPEVLMDGAHDIDRCVEVSEGQRMGTQGNFSGAVPQPRRARRHGTQAKHGGARQEVGKARFGPGSRGEDGARAQIRRAGVRSRHRLFVGRAIRRRGDRASRRH